MQPGESLTRQRSAVGALTHHHPDVDCRRSPRRGCYHRYHLDAVERSADGHRRMLYALSPINCVGGCRRGRLRQVGFRAARRFRY
jgi:hypothetical protein